MVQHHGPAGLPRLALGFRLGFGLGDPFHVPFLPESRLKLGNPKDAKHELPRPGGRIKRGIVLHLEPDTLLIEVLDDLAEVRRCASLSTLETEHGSYYERKGRAANQQGITRACAKLLSWSARSPCRALIWASQDGSQKRPCLPLLFINRFGFVPTLQPRASLFGQ
ncbi:hypothetical protein BQ8794_240083 [Mesorhizobium prunaredense]|uniref:Uncharacterized protein n=1 Tax=Mesorhizobium prunaredense TaxID=1631249 RepID=A0A1R3V7J5_9HYPH|nr:hypothetical protein BQ8794_240083 [Mesorhizobium prunaredense]